jgi:hypothetical protein
MFAQTATRLTLIATLALAAPAAASWPPGGMLVSSPGEMHGIVSARIMEFPAGDLALLGVDHGGNNNVYNLQRVSRDGVIAAGWPSGGVGLSSIYTGDPLPAQSIVVDDASRTWRSFVDYGYTYHYMLQSVSADAARVPAGTGYDLGSTSSGYIQTHAAPAPGGDVFVTCGSARLKRITVTGVPASGWTSTGVALPGTSYDDNAVLADGSGGVVVFMRSGAGSGTPIATRIDGNGVRHTGWPAGGVALSNVATSGTITMDSQLLPSGPDHMLAVWSPDVGSGTRRLMMQRFGLDATLDPAWPAGGLVVASDTLYACRALADGSGGAYVVRESHGRPVATHITAAGGTLGGTDVEFVDPGARYVGISGFGIPPGVMNPDAMMADVTPDGGLLVGWNDKRLAPAVSFRLRWLTPSLTPAPDKPDTGLVYFPGSHAAVGSMHAVHADGDDAAFVAWEDHSSYFDDLWMTRVQAPALVGVDPPSPRALALSAPRPNPARSAVAFDLTLPDDSPARVELLDIAGRAVRSKLVHGAGPHIVSFPDVGSLPPGLYLARVTTRTDSRCVRLALTH